MAATVLSIFTELYPNVMISSTSPANNLTINNTASGSYSLKLMTVVVVIFLPLVLAYTAWTYYVFRQRVSPGDFKPPRLVTPRTPPAPAASPHPDGPRPADPS